MTRDKWKIAKWIAIVYLILGAIFAVMMWAGYIVPGAGNQVVNFFLPAWALFAPFLPTS